VNIVLDTNILHQEGLGSRNMQLLSRLSVSGKVTVFIPDIVKREYLSKKIESAKDDLSVVFRHFEKIKRWIGSNKISEEIRDIERNFKELYQIIDVHIKSEFDSWVAVNNIEVIEFDPFTMDQILEDYFDGRGAFRKAKSREDFPDAMILTTIKDILEIGDTVYVVVKDGNFRNYLKTIDKLVTFESLLELYEFENIKKLIQNLDSESKRIEEIKLILASEEVQGWLKNYLTSDKSFLDSIYLEEGEVVLNDSFYVDCDSLRIEGIDIRTIKNIEFDGVKFTDDNSFSIGVVFSAKAGLVSVADYGTYINLSENRKSHICMESMNGEGWCDLSEELDFKFSGVLEIWLNEEMSPEQFRVHAQYISTDDSELVVDIEVKEARQE